jgi:hypothetical protein
MNTRTNHLMQVMAYIDSNVLERPPVNEDDFLGTGDPELRL